MDVTGVARALLLVSLASFAAWAVSRVLRDRLAAPLDGGWRLPDGRRLLGAHKTWRGLVAGVLVCALVAPLLDVAPATGAAFGAVALLGDALSSVVKRRLGLPPGAEAFGLDQVPEALLPLVVFAGPLGLGPLEIAVTVVAFTLLDIAATPLRR